MNRKIHTKLTTAKTISKTTSVFYQKHSQLELGHVKKPENNDNSNVQKIKNEKPNGHP